MGSGVRGLVAATAIGLGLAGCAATGDVRLAEPVTIALVAETMSAPCEEEAIASPDGDECLRLDQPLEVTSVQSIELAETLTAEGEQSGEQVVNMRLLEEDAEAFAALTAVASSEGQGRVAMVIDDEVVSAPVVMETIEAADLTITAWDGAADFVDRSN